MEYKIKKISEIFQKESEESSHKLNIPNYQHPWIQQPNARLFTPANTSEGVCHPNDFLGRLFNLWAIHSASAWVTLSNFAHLGKYCRIRPLVFSFLPRCHE